MALLFRFSWFAHATVLSALFTASAFAWDLPKDDAAISESYRRLSVDFSANKMLKNSAANTFRDGKRSQYIATDDPFLEQADALKKDVLKKLPDGKWISPTVFKRAMRGFQQIHANFPNAGIQKNILTIVDFNLKTESRRFTVLDLEHDRVLFQTWVHHGRNSDMDKDRLAERFSNVDSSFKSSVGFMITSNAPYNGRFGYSLRMHGIDGSLNSNMFSRAMVLHPWPSIHPRDLALLDGTQTSLGCLSLPWYESGKFYGGEDQPLSTLIIDTIKNRSVIFVNSSRVDLDAKSLYLKSKALLPQAQRDAIIAQIETEIADIPAMNAKEQELPAKYQYWKP